MKLPNDWPRSRRSRSIGEAILAGLPQRGHELLRKLIALLCSVPDGKQVTAVNAELQRRKDVNADFLAGLPQDRVPVHAIVVRHGEHADSPISVCLDQPPSERLIRLPAPDFAVPLTGVRRCMQLEIAEVEPGEARGPMVSESYVIRRSTACKRTPKGLPLRDTGSEPVRPTPCATDQVAKFPASPGREGIPVSLLASGREGSSRLLALDATQNRAHCATGSMTITGSDSRSLHSGRTRSQTNRTNGSFHT